MENKEDIIDLGEWKVPTSWDELSLKTFQEIERYYDDKDKKFDIREVLHILCGRSMDDINMLPVEFLDSILNRLEFLQTKPEEKEPTNEIFIDGVKYQVNIMEKLKTGEYVAADTIMKGDKHNYAGILAVLCRQEGEIYDSKFEAEVLNKRVEMFEKQPVVNILPIIGFFLQRYITSVTPTLLYSKVEEAIDLTRKNIETSQRNGEISKRSMKSAMKRLRKLEKYINSI